MKAVGLAIPLGLPILIGSMSYWSVSVSMFNPRPALNPGDDPIMPTTPGDDPITPTALGTGRTFSEEAGVLVLLFQAFNIPLGTREGFLFFWGLEPGDPRLLVGKGEEGLDLGDTIGFKGISSLVGTLLSFFEFLEDGDNKRGIIDFLRLCLKGEDGGEFVVVVSTSDSPWVLGAAKAAILSDGVLTCFFSLENADDEGGVDDEDILVKFFFSLTCSLSKSCYYE